MALKLRREGKLLKEIGGELGVGVERARSLIAAGERFEKLRNKERSAQ